MEDRAERLSRSCKNKPIVNTEEKEEKKPLQVQSIEVEEELSNSNDGSEDGNVSCV